MERGAKPAGARVSRQAAGAPVLRSAAATPFRRNLSGLFRNELAERETVRSRIQAARPTAGAHDAQISGRPEGDESRCRSESVGNEWIELDRLVCAITRWDARGRIAFGERQRGRNTLHLRNGH